MSQSQYIDKVLSKFEMSDCMPKSTPCAVGVEKECDYNLRELDDPRLYQAIVLKPDLCNDMYKTRFVLYYH